MKTKLAWAALGALVAILISSAITFFTSYEDNVSKMLPIYVKYKSESFVTELSADMYGYITHAEKTTLYFGELPSQEEAIEVNAPGRATIYVYPSDEDSLLIRYEPRGGIKRTFKKSGFGDFNRVLEVFYEHTKREEFNTTVTY